MVSVLDATTDRWDDLDAVMGTSGDPSRCFCQFFRMRQKDWTAAGRDGTRAALRAQLADPAPPGVLGYSDSGQPVGWCAVAVRSSYPRLATGTVSSALPDEDGLWAVTCFVVTLGARRQGISAALLDGALDLARRHGALAVEGYPVDTVAKKASAAELYHGSLSVFLRAGFIEVARPTPARAVVRLGLVQ